VHSYNGLGNAYNGLKDYNKAIKYYKKCLQIDEKYSFAYNGLGNSYGNLKEYVKAVESYHKAIEIDPKFVYPYNNMGIAYNKLKKNDKAIEYYDKAIRIDPLYANAYYNRGSSYKNAEKYLKAISDYKKYIDLTKDKPDYFTSLAKSIVADLNKLIKDPGFSAISELVDDIKKLLLYKEECITHYTSLSVSKKLILEDSLFRLSEGTFLNDTSEGRELYKVIPVIKDSVKINDTEAKPFSPKPFIGSFVAQTKHDDLTLWRMYGKENSEEAKGCAITIERAKLLEKIKNSLTADTETEISKKVEEEFSFYRVAYNNKQGQQQFVIPGSSSEEEKLLNEYILNLKNSINKYLIKKKVNDSQNILELLNGIAYLFKSAEYQYENELRLVIKGTGIPKIINQDFDPPRVYIELININSIIKKITFGPKVVRAEELASAFYYCLEKEDFHPEIVISHLPFK
jgi:tetratricopeptide (TPR) repeat protein